jgi:hypothetical protein
MIAGVTPNDRERARDWLALLLGEEPPDGTAAAGRVVLPVLSGSMHPDLPVGSTVAIRPGPWTATRDGDLIVFRRGETLVVHRRLFGLSVGPWSALYQKGNAVRYGGWIDPKLVVGRAVGVRLPNGEEVDLTTPAAHRRGLRNARRGLAADLIARFKRLLGRES